MPTAITLSGATFLTPLVPALPALANLEGWAYFGGDLARSQNVVTAAPWTNHPAGGPAYFPNYIRCINGAASLQTPLTLKLSDTTLIVSRHVPVSSPVGTQAFVVYGVVGGGGYLAYLPYSGGATGLQIFGVSGTVDQRLVDHPVTNWRFYATTLGNNTNTTVYDLTNNLSSVAASPYAGLVGAQLKGLGGHATILNSANNQSVDIAFFASYSAILSKANIDLIYASVKASMALRGIVV